MQTNVLWSGQEYRSKESCLVRTTTFGHEVTSTIIGYYQGRIFKVDYLIKTNQRWETLIFEISGSYNDRSIVISFKGDGLGNWYRDGHEETQFKGCIDIDLPLTPFTNTLPVKRLQLKDGEQAEIRVIYIDLLADEIRPVKQKYVRRSATVYHYENVPNDFEADIVVDEFGLVVDYPTLFVRSA